MVRDKLKEQKSFKKKFSKESSGLSSAFGVISWQACKKKILCAVSLLAIGSVIGIN